MEQSRDLFIRKIVIILLVATMLLVFVTLGFSVAFDAKTEQHNTLLPVSMNGEFSADDGQWQDFEGSPYIDEDVKKVIVRAHVTDSIENGTDVMFFAQRIYVTLKVNELTVIDIHKTENTPNNIMATGSTWATFKSEGISVDDELQFTITSSRDRLIASNVEGLFESACQGDAEVLYQKMLEENGIQMFFGLVAIFGGLVILVMGLCALGSNYTFMRRIVAISLMIIFGGIWFLLDTNCVYLSMIIPSNAVHNFLDFGVSFLLPLSVVLYVLTLLDDGKVKRIVYDIIFIMFILTIVSFTLQLLGLKQLYDMQELAIICGLLMLAALGVFMVFSVKERVQLNIIVLLALVPGVIGAFIQVMSYLSEGSFAVEHFLSIGILVSVLSQLVVLIADVRKNAKRLSDLQALENQQMKSRILITLSQLQPHFLFNALNAIQYLCMINPEKAKRAIENFAKCLRANIDSLRINHPIAFTQELKHLKSYVYMERVRFGDEIDVTYDIETEEFFVPPLTVQPIVENAIRHGITQRDGGGHIVVSTREAPQGVMITITDDGIGFDVKEMEESVRAKGYEIDAQKPRVGIPTVKNRLKAMCNGTLTVESALDKGTTVKIFIPDE